MKGEATQIPSIVKTPQPGAAAVYPDGEPLRRIGTAG
jgi:hypothetical protein